MATPTDLIPSSHTVRKASGLLLTLCIVFTAIGGGFPAPACAQPKEQVQFKDIAGNVQQPLGHKDKKATVLFFLLPDCPNSNAYAPEIQRICADYAPRQVAAFVVHADPDLGAEQAKKHAQEYGLKCPVLLDPAHVLVKRTGVAMAPEVAVLGPEGKVLYRGRIDDLFVDYGKRRAEPTQRDLRIALDAILQGRAVPNPVTKAIGCYLPQPRK